MIGAAGVEVNIPQIATAAAGGVPLLRPWMINLF